FYAYVFKPWLLDQSGWLPSYFDTGNVMRVQILNMLAVAMFAAGCVCNSTTLAARLEHKPVGPLPPKAQNHIVSAAIILGTIALSAFLYMLADAGGLRAAYSQAKGGIVTANGYLGEAP